MLPQPSPTAPQLAPACAHVRGVHEGAPHWLATPPPPQVAGDVQVPHERMPPQPSPTAPQIAPACAHVRGVHGGTPHWLAAPAPPQLAGGAHIPQSITP